MGGRFGRQRLSKHVKFAGGATNFGIASYGAAIKALAEGYESLEAIIQAILTGRPEDFPNSYNDIDTALTKDEQEALDNLNLVLSEVMSLSRISPGPTSIREFCTRPENIHLNELCQ